LDLPPGGPIQKQFLTYILLNELSKYPEGISGYRIRKSINTLISTQLEKDENNPLKFFSQSLVYRIFEGLKFENLVNSTPTTIKNRTQVLYTLNERGEKRLALLKRMIHNFTPIEVDPNSLVKDLLAGKISPLDLTPKNIPKAQLLEMLKTMRRKLEWNLTELNAKIEKIEKELSV
jgi:DNA-binding PadR family transcriptional regulator